MFCRSCERPIQKFCRSAQMRNFRIMDRIAFMHRVLPIHGAYCDLKWKKLGFARVSARISTDFARVSAKMKLEKREGAQLPRLNYLTYVNNTLLDQSEAVQCFRLRFFSALRTDRMIGRNEPSSCISAFPFQEERRDEQIAHLRVPPDDETKLCRNSPFAARGLPRIEG